jgi:hypothetical protein
LTQERKMQCDGCKNSGKLKEVGYSDNGAGEPVLLCKDCRRPDNVVLIRTRLDVAPRDDQKKDAQAQAKALRETQVQREQERVEDRAEIKKRGKAKTRPTVGKTGKTARNRAKKMALKKT